MLATTIPNIDIITTYKFTVKELAFISAYLSNGGNGTQAAIEAGYASRKGSANPATMASRASDLLRQENIRGEIEAQIAKRENAKIAKPAEILQFYTSVMRGEVLDQFGIEASLDTRIKAANELAKQQIEIPMKLQQKEMSNNIGSITLNFLPRKEDNEEIQQD